MGTRDLNRIEVVGTPIAKARYKFPTLDAADNRVGCKLWEPRGWPVTWLETEVAGNFAD